MDPIELRLRNEPDEGPDLRRAILIAPSRRRRTHDGAKRFGWDQAQRTRGAAGEGEWLIGMGCATATYPYYRMPGGAARITLTDEGHATSSIAAHEMGMGTATVADADHAPSGWACRWTR